MVICTWSVGYFQISQTLNSKYSFQGLFLSSHHYISLCVTCTFLDIRSYLEFLRGVEAWGFPKGLSVFWASLSMENVLGKVKGVRFNFQQRAMFASAVKVDLLSSSNTPLRIMCMCVFMYLIWLNQDYPSFEPRERKSELFRRVQKHCTARVRIYTSSCLDWCTFTARH